MPIRVACGKRSRTRFLSDTRPTSEVSCSTAWLRVPPGLAMGVPLVLLIVFLLIRPTGLLRAREAQA